MGVGYQSGFPYKDLKKGGWEPHGCLKKEHCIRVNKCKRPETPLSLSC